MADIYSDYCDLSNSLIPTEYDEACMTDDLDKFNELLALWDYYPERHVGKFIGLHVPCHYHAQKILQKVITRPDIQVNTILYYGNTVLYNACAINDIPIIKILLTCPGIDVNSYGKRIYTAIGVAIINDCTEAIELMLADPRTNINHKKENGKTMLHMLVRSGDIEMLQKFLQIVNIDTE